MSRGSRPRSRRWVLIAPALLWMACPSLPERPDETMADPHHDWDSDGFCEQDPCAGAAEPGDCDDEQATVHPGADEACDGLDSDCDGVVPDDELDDDGDGFEECGIGGAAADCDDGDPDIHPEAVEICNGLDDDCDPGTDESADGDGDGASLCDGDCDDGDERIGPAAVELCDGVDNDCDAELDEDCVDCSRWVPDDHAGVQEALDSADAGETICVAPGEYVGTISWGGFEGRLLGVSGPEMTVLDGGGQGTVVTFAAGVGPAATLAGFSVTGGSGDDGGGISVIDSSPTLQHLIVRGNEAAHAGGGIALTGSGTSLADVRIEDNIAIEDGGGLHVEGLSSITIEYARVAGNRAEKGGGIRLIDGSDVVIHNAVFADNQASLKGGGVYIYSATAILDHVRITGNSSGEDGGGLRVRSSASATVSNGIIAGNLAANDGGGVHLIGFVEAALTNVAIVGNEAVASGGGIFVNLSSTIAYTNAEISSNTAAAGGGVFTEDGAVLTAVRSNAVANAPSQYDGAVADPTGTLGNVIQPPGYLDTSADDPSDWDLHLDLDSGIVDIGSADLTDPDGGPSDIGAYGGEEADGWDLDHDGYPEWWQPGAYDPGTHPADGWDCDDTDPAVHADDGC